MKYILYYNIYTCTTTIKFLGMYFNQVIFHVFQIFAEKKHIPHIETSAKLNENVTDMFMSVIKRLTENGGDGTGDNDDDVDDSDDGGDTVPITSKKNSTCSCVIS